MNLTSKLEVELRLADGQDDLLGLLSALREEELEYELLSVGGSGRELEVHLVLLDGDDLVDLLRCYRVELVAAKRVADPEPPAAPVPYPYLQPYPVPYIPPYNPPYNPFDPPYIWYANGTGDSPVVEEYTGDPDIVLTDSGPTTVSDAGTVSSSTVVVDHRCESDLMSNNLAVYCDGQLQSSLM